MSFRVQQKLVCGLYKLGGIMRERSNGMPYQN